MNRIAEYLNSSDIQFEHDVSLREISTFKIGGNARIICYPDSTEKVMSLVKYCVLNNIDYYTFGRCSNVVFPDEGINTLIIKTDALNCCEFSDGIFSFGAGVMLAKAAKTTVDMSYAGMEALYGIPGSVGGAVYMNAGAYGSQISDVLYKTEYVNDKGDLCTLDLCDHDFSYRHSFFSDKNYVITKVYFKLSKGNKCESEMKIAEYQTARKEKQPLELPSAGSVFKRPEGYFAGKLIQDSNLKGYTIGGAQVSEKHSGFIVNISNATYEDVFLLVDHIKQTVKQNFNVDLECELKFIKDK